MCIQTMDVSCTIKTEDEQLYLARQIRNIARGLRLHQVSAKQCAVFEIVIDRLHVEESTPWFSLGSLLDCSMEDIRSLFATLIHSGILGMAKTNPLPGLENNSVPSFYSRSFRFVLLISIDCRLVYDDEDEEVNL